MWAELTKNLDKKLSVRKPEAILVQDYLARESGAARDWSKELSGEGAAFEEFCKVKVLGKSSFPMALGVAPKLDETIAAACGGSCDAALKIVADVSCCTL